RHRQAPAHQLHADHLLRGRHAPGAGLGEAFHGARVTAVPATLAKGLEYDHVIVAEPAAIVEAEPRGMNRLYVVLTRAVSRLEVVHARPLPAGIAQPFS
ncbi:ATP-binding domain-containing protein, partial [Streptosporangium algeriense]